MIGEPSQSAAERYEKLFAMLFEAIPSSVLLIGRDRRIFRANRNFLEKNRRSLAVTLGRRLEEVFPAILLDEMDFTNRISALFDKDQPTRGERLTYRTPGLPLRTYYYSILPFSSQGVAESAMLLMEDVTEQLRLAEEVQRVEHHLASVVESASEIVLSTDIEGRVLTWNTAAEGLSGYSFSEVKGRPFFEYGVADRQAEIKKAFTMLRTGLTSQMAEWDLRTKKGEILEISWVLTPLKDRNFQTVGGVVVGRDLTERRKIERQLQHSQKLAALGVMAGGIAHEVRNPLAICSSAAQFLLEEIITPQFRQECAAKIHISIKRAADIIENLLAFGRPAEASHMQEVSLVAVLNTTLALVQNQAKIQKVRIETLFPPERICVHGNVRLLEQAFLNLLLNATNAMPQGGQVQIAVRILRDMVLIAITDTGLGISRENLEKIFDPFYTTSVVGKGTGLGLSICYSIIKQHFGSIEVESTERIGSTFTVYLPILGERYEHHA